MQRAREAVAGPPLPGWGDSGEPLQPAPADAAPLPGVAVPPMPLTPYDAEEAAMQLKVGRLSASQGSSCCVNQRAALLECWVGGDGGAVVRVCHKLHVYGGHAVQ